MAEVNVIVGDVEGDTLQWREGSGNTIEIYDIEVRSERRQGRGRELVQKLFKKIELWYPDCNLVWAITRTTNEIAQEFYEALGFRVVGVLREFYSNEQGVDAIMYGRSPKGAI